VSVARVALAPRVTRGPRLAVTIALVASGLFGPNTGEAQPADKVARIGYLSVNLAAAPPNTFGAFRQGLRDLGYVEGRSVVIEYRDAAGNPDRLPVLAAELVALKVDVIVVGGSPQAVVAKRATTTIPIVFISSGDPVSDGLVASLGRPGGNVTGLSSLTPDRLGKCLDLLTQAVPGVSRVAILWQPDAVGERTGQEALQTASAAARALGVRLQVVAARTPADIDTAFADLTKARAEALVVWTTPMFAAQLKRLVALAAKHRLPAVYTLRSSSMAVV
jgi:ABC-type uncharacterized transport system substrate-binding protein